MNRVFIGGLWGMILALLAGPVQAEPRRSLACCNCLGEADASLDLSTGQSGPNDPLWNVDNGIAYQTPPYTNWLTTLNPAQWIQPVASPTPSTSIPLGVFHYKLQFYIPNCVIPMTVHLTGSFAADNSGTVSLDGNALASCSSGSCFYLAMWFGVATLAPGFHVLQVDVTNNVARSASGLIVSAHLIRHCTECDHCPVIGSYDGANCYIGSPPTGTTAFIYANNFYYTPVNGNQCPLPNSWFDSLNCFMMPIPTQTTPFIFQNGWYVQSAPCHPPPRP